MDVENEFDILFQNNNHTFPNVSPSPDICSFESITDIDSIWALFNDPNCFRYPDTPTLMVSLLYGLIFLCGLVGNVLVVLVVAWKRRMRTVTNFFIANLAVADLLVNFCCLPATLLANIFIPWVLGEILCKAVPYIQGVSIIASVLSLVAVTVDRCRAIYRPMPFSRCLSKRQFFVTVAFIWLIALLLTVPWLSTFELVYFPETGKLPYCHEKWSVALHGQIYFFVVHLLFCFWIPVWVIIVCNCLIWKNITRRGEPDYAANIIIPSSRGRRSLREINRRKKMRIFKMLCYLAAAFFGCWFPLYVVMSRIKFLGTPEHDSWETTAIQITIPIAQLLGACNSCLNPILYSFCSKRFRKSLGSIINESCCAICVASNRPARRAPVVPFRNTNTSLPNPATLSSADRVEQSQQAAAVVQVVQESAGTSSRTTPNSGDIPLRVFTLPSRSRSSSSVGTTQFNVTGSELRNRSRNVCTTRV